MRSDLSPLFDCARITVRKSHGAGTWLATLWFSVHTCWQTTAVRMFSTKGPETSGRALSLLLLPISRKIS